MVEMLSVLGAIVFVVLVAALWAAAVYLPVRTSVDLAAELERRSGRPRPLPPQIAVLWASYEHLAPLELERADFREAGWSEGHAAHFLDWHFAGRERVVVAELRPHMADVLVRDVLEYRRIRFDAARRYQAIRYTWVNVDDAERKGLIPEPMRPFVVERPRQSGKLVWASDLLRFVGRPFVRDLLERRLQDGGVVRP
jgi:hypothetical protein